MLAEGLTFWNLFLLLVIFLPLIFLWGFVFVDIFRRDDLKPAITVLWLVVVLFMPLIGTLIYFAMRPAGLSAREREVSDKSSWNYAPQYAPPSRADQLKVLSDLHDRGKLNDAEYEAEKAKLG